MTEKITIMDGGMGRLLKEMGAPFKQPEWSALALMEAPDCVEKAHQQYIDAGAQIIITNSYAVVPFHIGPEKFDREGRELIKLAAQIARQTADKAQQKITVAGSIPPAFGSYRPDFYIEEQADAIYLPLIEEQAPYIDVFLAETVSSTREVEKIGTLLKGKEKPFWLSYTLRDRDGREMSPQLRSQEPIEKAVETALRNNIDCLLFNCSQPEEIAPVLEIIQSMDIGIPYGAYANAFEPVRHNQQANSGTAFVREDTTPDIYLDFARKWQSLGASIIGGCCGIGPAHIKELNKLTH